MVKASIEIQKGLVDHKTITSEIGAIVTARFTKKKFICPAILLQKSMHFLSAGNSFIGLCLAQEHHISDIKKPEMLRKIKNSIG